MRLEIAKQLHCDLGGNLSTIKIQTEILKNKSVIGDKERRQLDRVSNMAKETAYKVREATWLIDSDYDTLDRLIERVNQMGTSMFEGHIPFTFLQQPPQMPPLGLDMKFKENVYFFIKEVLNNSNKYSKANSVCLSIELKDKLLNISIRDNGIGFNPNTIKRGNGLKLMQNRADELKGDFNIFSKPGKGTKTTLKVLIP